jgi:hypothetical protein
VEVKQGAGRLVRTARLALQAYLRAGWTQHAAAISYALLARPLPRAARGVYGTLGAVLALLLLVYVEATVPLAGACLAATWPQTADSLGRAVVRDDGIAQKMVGASGSQSQRRPVGRAARLTTRPPT